MTILSNLSNLGVANHRKIKTLGYFRLRSSALQIQQTQAKTNMDKRRIKIAVKMINEVKLNIQEVQNL